MGICIKLPPMWIMVPMLIILAPYVMAETLAENVVSKIQRFIQKCKGKNDIQVD